MPETTVCFIARLDFESKPGGDTIQWQMYDAAARAAGLTTTTWFDDSPLPLADVFHAFNIDRPLELYPKLIQVRRRALPFVLSTIHHPHDWLARFRRFEPPTGTLGRLLYRSPIGRSVAASEAVREVAMLVSQRRLTHMRDVFPMWTKRVRWLLTNADRIALLTATEGTYLQRDFRYSPGPTQPLIVPNWVEAAGSTSAPPPGLFGELPEAPVIVVGRIEPRKNSVRVCALADKAQRHVVFIGRPHPSETAFFEAFTATVRASRYAHWVPAVPRAEMAQFYCHASFLLNASLVEVSPLVDIEALALGCPIVTTKYAVHHELLPPDTPRCDPYDERSILEHLQWRPQRRKPQCVVDGGRCKRELVAAYVALTQSRRNASFR